MKTPWLQRQPLRAEKDFLRFNVGGRSPRLRPTTLWIEQGYGLAQALIHGKAGIKSHLG